MEMLQWLGRTKAFDPEYFDVEKTNKQFRKLDAYIKKNEEEWVVKWLLTGI